MNILLCTLGQTWAVIPEAFGLLDPVRCPIYRDHPGHTAIEDLRRKHELRPVDELWVCTTFDPGFRCAPSGLRCIGTGPQSNPFPL